METLPNRDGYEQPLDFANCPPPVQNLLIKLEINSRRKGIIDHLLP